jgi:hypothetical protein
MQVNHRNQEATPRQFSPDLIEAVSRRSGGWRITLCLVFLGLMSAGVWAQTAGTGALPDPHNVTSDQKPGSVLVFPVYTSSADVPHLENTRLSITNTSHTQGVFMHIFFVDGASCGPADSFACLTPEQTLSFLTSDYDPNTTGYLVVVAVNSQGCPVSFNNLIGDAYVKFQSGHAVNYGAEAFAALWTNAQGQYADNVVLPGCNAFSVVATLPLDGSATGYNAAPRELAIEGLTSPADGGNSMLFVMRVGGDLTTRGGFIGRLQGILFDDVESPFSFVSTLGEKGCQFRVTISDFFPRIVPRYSVIVRRGRIGWIKVWAISQFGLLGVVLHNKAGELPAGRSLHKLSTIGDSFIIPLYPPLC